MLNDKIRFASVFEHAKSSFKYFPSLLFTNRANKIKLQLPCDSIAQYVA